MMLIYSHYNQTPMTLNNQKNHGFTLIEVLIALLILAIVSTIAVTGLQAVIISDKRQIEITDQLAELQFTYVLIQRDLSQAINRPILDGAQESRPGWLGARGLGVRFMSDIPIMGEIMMEFTRAGIPNPQELPERSTLVRVAYTYDGKKLMRYEWPVLDRTKDSVVSYRTLLPDITEVNFIYYDKYGEAKSSWVTEVSQVPGWLANYPGYFDLPSAVEWSFVHPRYGIIMWRFKVNESNYAETTR
ncbi:MAG: type II secretion system minor pseudopilin GspJ [Gammaproteobacteria bacterium]